MTSAGPAGALSLVTAIRLAGGRKTNQFDAVNSARAHADQLAAKLGRNRSARESHGRFIRVTTKMAKKSTGLP